MDEDKVPAELAAGFIPDMNKIADWSQRCKHCMRSWSRRNNSFGFSVQWNKKIEGCNQRTGHLCGKKHEEKDHFMEYEKVIGLRHLVLNFLNMVGLRHMVTEFAMVIGLFMNVLVMRGRVITHTEKGTINIMEELGEIFLV